MTTAIVTLPMFAEQLRAGDRVNDSGLGADDVAELAGLLLARELRLVPLEGEPHWLVVLPAFETAEACRG